MTVFEGTFTQTESLRFAIVIGRFNDLIVNKLLEGCQDCLKRHGVDIILMGIKLIFIGFRDVLRFPWWRAKLLFLAATMR